MNYVRLIIYRNYNYDISFPENNKNINAKFRKLADSILVESIHWIYTEITFLHLEMNLRIELHLYCIFDLLILFQFRFLVIFKFLHFRF